MHCAEQLTVFGDDKVPVLELTMHQRVITASIWKVHIASPPPSTTSTTTTAATTARSAVRGRRYILAFVCIL